MSAMSFNLTTHSLHGGQIVEIIQDGKVVGVMYPDHNRQSVHVVSAHVVEQSQHPEFSGHVVDETNKGIFKIPTFSIKFAPSPWSFTKDGKVFKQTS